MDHARLGASGLSVSRVGLGCNNLGRRGTVTEHQDGASALVHAALDAGITFFDTANSYGPATSETLLGEALKGRRDDVVVATKFGMKAHDDEGPDFGARGSRRHVKRSVEHSLRRLQTDRIDLYQYHTPDADTPIDETISALDDLVREGKVLYVGHSNLAGWQIADAAHVAESLGGVQFVSAQNHYNLLDRRAEQEVIPAAEHFGLGVLPFFPLANGLLTGKYSDGVAPAGSRLALTRQHLLDDENTLATLRKFGEFARARDLTELQVAFSWLASRGPVASVIAGATTPEQIRQNAESIAWVPTEEDEAELDELFPAVPKVAPF
ncbi:aldo/keto reductase [Georgenia sp. Z1344]|uniref:aldo/keto reductase n=1 Tax=Georgenia sp. Z1344 TaxID=3416706 RepID=UPI003CE7EF45